MGTRCHLVVVDALGVRDAAAVSLHVVPWRLYTCEYCVQHQEDNNTHISDVSRSFSGPHAPERKRDRAREKGRTEEQKLGGGKGKKRRRDDRQKFYVSHVSQTLSEPGDAKLRSILLNDEETWLALELVCAELIVWTMFRLPMSEQTWPT